MTNLYELGLDHELDIRAGIDKPAYLESTERWESVQQVCRLLLPPVSVIRYLERAVLDNGRISDEAAIWLTRVRAARGLQAMGE